MNLFADESLDRPVVERLRQDGHHAVYVAELSPGITDDEVLRLANDSDALLLTSDNDFGELVFRQGRIHNGVVLLRLAGFSAVAKATLVAQVLHDHEAELPGSFSVISPGTVRVRRRL